MTTEPTTTPTLAQLEERVRAGDTSITAQQLAEAREADHLASLRQEADERAQAATQAAEHKAAVEQLAKDYAELQDADSAPAREAYADLVQSSKTLLDRLAEFDTKRRAVTDKAMELGVALQCHDQFRIPSQPAGAYLKHAADEASGRYWATGNGASPHALHSNKLVAKYEEDQRLAREAEERNQALIEAQSQRTIELGYGKYARVES